MKIAIIGSNGKMGTKMRQYLDSINISHLDIDINSNKSNQIGSCNVLLDFSCPQALSTNLKLALKHHIPLVIATTGHDQSNLKLIKTYSKDLPILLSSNFSIGFNALLDILDNLKSLKSFDFNLTEIHHKTKLDSPSGSAKTILAKLNNLSITPTVNAVRVGNMVGKHTLEIFGEDESLTISHTAYDRRVFCVGAYRACQFIVGKPNKLYSMGEVLNDSI